MGSKIIFQKLRLRESVSLHDFVENDSVRSSGYELLITDYEL